METTTHVPSARLAALQREMEELRFNLSLARIAKKKLAVELEE